VSAITRPALLASLSLLLAAGCDSRWPQNRQLVCGDGVADGEEICDGADVRGKTCEALGFSPKGVLSCKAGCKGFDVSGCSRCGDGKKGTGEACDGKELGQATCKDQGFSGGKLGCHFSCQSFDTSGCYKCGDGRVDTGELCDGPALASQTCKARGFEGGTLACGASCKAFDTSGCYRCGDGKITGTDLCDGADVGNKNCEGFGFEAGTLKCRKDCKWYDFTGCYKCGDGAITGKDKCDGKDLGGKTCASLGYYAGVLGCRSDCTLDSAACMHHVTDYAVTPGTMGSKDERVTDVVVDSKGDAYVVGEWREKITAGGATYTTGWKPAGFVARLGAGGKVAWFMPIHGGATASGSVQYLRLALGGAKDLRVVGSFQGTLSAGSKTLTSVGKGYNAFVLSLDRAGGKVAWAAHAKGPASGTGVLGRGIIADHAGDAYVVGAYYSGEATFGSSKLYHPGNTSKQLFLAKLTSVGAWAWATGAGAGDLEEANDVALDVQGNIYLTGRACAGTVFGSTTLSSKVGEYGNLFVAKANAAGQLLWGVAGHDASGIFSSAGSRGYRIDVDAAGNAYVTGRQYGSITYGGKKVSATGKDDVVVAATSTSGKFHWGATFGGSGDDEGHGIHVTSAGSLFVTGFFNTSASGGGAKVSSAGAMDVLLLRLDNKGAIKWATAQGGAGNDAAWALAGAPGGLLYLGGSYQATAAFGSKSLTSAGGADAVLLKLKGNP